MGLVGCECGAFLQQTAENVKAYQALMQEFRDQALPEWREWLTDERRWLKWLERSHLKYCLGEWSWR